jgi:hypothetical protein
MMRDEPSWSTPKQDGMTQHHKESVQKRLDFEQQQ